MVQTGKIIMRRLPPGCDLLTEINRIAYEEEIELGIVSGIGALSKAALGIFLQDRNEYKTNFFEQTFELCTQEGKVSFKDGRHVVHIHLVLSDEEGRAIGGHCFEGCEVVVCELVIRELLGEELHRVPQEECSGLSLWDR